MTLPIDLVLVRHGQSEANYARRLSEKGDHSGLEKLRGKHTASFRLTELGRRQAIRTGVYVNKRFGNFDRKYTSEYVRAMETAGLMNLGGPKWFCDFFISERIWGDLDSLTEQERQEKFGEALKMRNVEPFFWSPPGGESFAQLCLRVDRMLATLARECSDKRVVIVCHGEVMWAFRIRLERMSQVRFKELHLSKKGEDRIHNCQILHYMRRDPETGALSKYYDHMQIIRPTESPVTEFPVMKIERPSYSDAELLGVVDNFEQLVA